MVQSSTFIILIRKAPLLLLSLFLTSTLTITVTSASSPITFSRNTAARTISSKSLQKNNTPYLTHRSVEEKKIVSQNQNKLM